jgi:sugar O-acyltransferase (sialic acid O-acetyltransferase NeuD family)
MVDGMTDRIVILGGGGHSLVVAEAAHLAGVPIAGFFDDDPDAPATVGDHRLPYLGGLDMRRLPLGCRWILGVGNIDFRKKLLAACPPELRERAVTIVHPGAFVSPTARLARGVWVGPGAIINTRVHVGEHAIINSGSVVEHDGKVGFNAHVAPRAALGGRVEVLAHTLIGIGASVLPSIRIGTGCLVGAGAVVIRHVDDGERVVGVPARVMSQRSS